MKQNCAVSIMVLLIVILILVYFLIACGTKIWPFQQKDGFARAIRAAKTAKSCVKDTDCAVGQICGMGFATRGACQEFTSSTCPKSIVTEWQCKAGTEANKTTHACGGQDVAGMPSGSGCDQTKAPHVYSNAPGGVPLCYQDSDCDITQVCGLGTQRGYCSALDCPNSNFLCKWSCTDDLGSKFITHTCQDITGPVPTGCTAPAGMKCILLGTEYNQNCTRDADCPSGQLCGWGLGSGRCYDPTSECPSLDVCTYQSQDGTKLTHACSTGDATCPPLKGFSNITFGPHKFGKNYCITPLGCAGGLAKALDPNYPYLIANRVPNPMGDLDYRQLWWTDYHGDPATTCPNTHIVLENGEKVTKHYPCNWMNPFPGPQFWKPDFVTVEKTTAICSGSSIYNCCPPKGHGENDCWDGIKLKLDKIPGVFDADGNPVWAGSEIRSCAPAQYGEFVFSVKFLNEGAAAYQNTYTDPVTGKIIPGAWNVTFGAYTYKPNDAKTSGIGFCWPNICNELDFLEWGKSRSQANQGPSQWGIQPWYECCTAADMGEGGVKITGCAAPTTDNGCPIPPGNPASESRVQRWDPFNAGDWGALYGKWDNWITIKCKYDDPDTTVGAPQIHWEARLGHPTGGDAVIYPWLYDGPIIAQNTLCACGGTILPGEKCPTGGKCSPDNLKYFPRIDDDTYIMFNLWMGSAYNPCGSPYEKGQGGAHPIDNRKKEVLITTPQYKTSVGSGAPIWNSVCWQGRPGTTDKCPS